MSGRYFVVLRQEFIILSLEDSADLVQEEQAEDHVLVLAQID